MKPSPILLACLFACTLIPTRAAAQGFLGSLADFPPPITASMASSSGPGHPWQGSLSGINPFSRARQVDIPILAFGVRGGLPFGFALHHNSKAVFSNPALGPKWSHSFDTHLDVWPEPGTLKAALVWGDHRVQLFQKIGASWTALDGYRDQLAPLGSSYVVTLRE